MTSPDNPLATPIHPELPKVDQPWRDNAFLAFWDPSADVYGVVHASTSPNAEGRRIRLSLSHGGQQVEIIDDLDRGTYVGERVTFGLTDGISVSAPRLTGHLDLEGLFAVGDYSAGNTFDSIVEGERLNHFQQASTVRGTLHFDGKALHIDGRAFRDRTWGYREETRTFTEVITVMAVFEDRAISALRFQYTDGSDRAEGFILGEGTEDVVGVREITRDASGLFVDCEIVLDGGSQVLTATEVHGGFWVPQGSVSKGPAIAGWDQFCTFDHPEYGVGHGIVEQSFIRRLT